MTIKVYAHEKIDGLEKAIASSCSIAYTSNIDTSTKNFQSWLDHSKNAQATNLNQEDLFYLRSVLVSSGWNLNDDIFVPTELWAARKTPEDKQFNFMHQELDIIGHITANEAYDFDGNIISDDAEELPENFNIITNAVIYRNWSDVNQKERIEKLIAEIKEGKWFVSMECFFPAFDYALKNDDGEIRLIDRNEASAFLTKHLRVYGGSGQYENYKIGRVLRNLTFCGKGLVNQPANPRSIILQEETLSHANKQETDDMSEDMKKKLEQVEAELASAKTELMNAQSAVQSLSTIKAEAESLKAMVAQKEDALATLSNQNKELQETIASLKASLEAAEAAREELGNKVKDIEAKAKLESRKAALVDAGVESTDLDDALASFDSMEDAAFEKMIAVMKKGKKDKKDYKEETEEDDSAANLESLDDANVSKDASASVTETEEENTQEKLRSEATSFFQKTLATTKNNK